MSGQRGGCGECVPVHWYTLSKNSGHRVRRNGTLVHYEQTLRTPCAAQADGDDDVDISNLNIPEGSRDVIWRMLTGGFGSAKSKAGGSGGGSGSGSGSNSPRGGVVSVLEGIVGPIPLVSPRNPSPVGRNSRSGGRDSRSDVRTPGLDAVRESGTRDANPSPSLLDNFHACFGGSFLGSGCNPWAFIVITGVMLLAFRAVFGFGLGWLPGFGAGDLGGAASDVAFWERKAAMLEGELQVGTGTSRHRNQM